MAVGLIRGGEKFREDAYRLGGSLLVVKDATGLSRMGIAYDASTFPGADLTGATSSRDAVQRAIDKAYNYDQSGGAVYLAPGDWLIDSGLDVPDNIGIYGAGPRRAQTATNRATVIKRGFSGTLINAAGSGPSSRRFGVVLSGFTIDGGGTGGGFTGTAIDISESVLLQIFNVEVVQNIGRAMLAKACWDTEVYNMLVRSCGSSGSTIPAIDVGTTTTETIGRMDFYSLHCESNFYTHFKMADTGGGGDPAWLTFTNPKFHDSQVPASQITVPMVDIADSRYTQIQGGEFVYSKGIGLKIGGDRCRVSTTLIQNGTTAAPSAVQIASGSRSRYEFIVGSNVSPSTANINILSAATNSIVRYIQNGSGTHYADAGSGNVVINEQDGVMRHNSLLTAVFPFEFGEELRVVAGGGSGRTWTPNFRTVAIFERNDDCAINIVAPATKVSSIWFGNPSNEIRARIRVDHSTDKMHFYTAGALRFTIDALGRLELPVLTDANRGSAGTAGRVIYNSTDANLNIDNGTNWILPDGTTT